MVELDIPALPSLDTAVGIDLGIRDFATCSDGTGIPNPRYLEHAQGKLRRLQRLFSRKYEYAKTHGKTRTVKGKEFVVQSNAMRRLQEQIRRPKANEVDTSVIYA